MDCTPVEGFAWIVILSGSQSGQARSASFQLPRQAVELIGEGMELGAADDLIFGTENSKQAGGAVGLLTGDVVVRSALYEMPTILALIPWKNPSLY